MRKSKYFLSGVICTVFSASPSFAQTIDDWVVDITPTPAQFGPVGSFVKLRMEPRPETPQLTNLDPSKLYFQASNSLPNGSGRAPNDPFGFLVNDNGSNSACDINYQVCECAYRVTQDNVNDGFVYFTAAVDNMSSDGSEILYGSGSTHATHDPSVTPFVPPSGMKLCYNRAPDIDVGPDLYLIAGTSYPLTPTVSDFEGDPLLYRWVLNNFSSPQFSSPNTKNTNITANFPSATLGLKVMDGHQSTRGRLFDYDSLNVVTTLASGCAPQASALMPSTIIPGNFTFTIPAAQVCPSLFWIDPPVATGYDYTVSGAQFLEIKMPDLTYVDDQDGYSLTYNNGSPIPLVAGQSYSFPSPVNSFSLNGIDPTLQLDPDSPQAFAIGIDVSNPTPGATHVEINQAVVTEVYPPTPAQCPPFKTVDFRNILPVVTQSLNGRYTRTLNKPKMEAMMADFLADARVIDPNLANVEAEFRIENYGPGPFPAGYVGPVTGMDRTKVSYDGSTLTLYDPVNPTVPLDEFWAQKNLDVDTWYALSVRSYKDGNGSSCGTNSYQFRLPTTVSGGRVSFKRPVEIFENAQTSQYNVTLAAVNARRFTGDIQPEVIANGGGVTTGGSTMVGGTIAGATSGFGAARVGTSQLGSGTITRTPVRVVPPAVGAADIKPAPAPVKAEGVKPLKTEKEKTRTNLIRNWKR